MSKIQSRKAVEIKIATVVAVVVILRETDLTAIEAAIRDTTGGESDYFDNELAVADVAAFDLVDQAIDWAQLRALFKSYSLNLVAVRNARPDMEAGILAQGLSLDASVKPRAAVAVAEAAPAESEPDQAAEVEAAPTAFAEPIAEPAAAHVQPAAPTQEPAQAAAKRPSMIVDTPVRGGQRIYARGCDLIVTAMVNHGAEVIADGSIHIYAPLRGRALAGASGDATARIFAMSMEADLVSIAGTYRTFDDGLPKNLAQQPVQISLDGDRIDLHPMSMGKH
ncbi:MAG TPA: septum site-determining protein MinC [Burkholderiaceae bacterium]